MTLKQIRDQVIYTLGLQDDTTFNETGFVEQLIFQATTDIVAMTRPTTRCLNLHLQAGAAAHDVSQTVIALKDIATLEGKFLDRYTREDIVRRQRDGGSGYAYSEPMLWISPIPSEPTTVKAYGTFRPIKMTADTDSPEMTEFGGLAPEFHPTIVTYCLWKGAEYMQHEASGQGERWRIQYEGQDGKGGELGKIRRVLSKRVTPGGPRRRNPARTIGVVPDATHYMGG